ncbi:PIG-L deacetylase family protein [Leisingera sp. XS_AS12]|uniref:PIG-L deacetylase family protein n=1 Tax=Leisingera sp. XS_AS12 TaxID=3241294 RepID=UPI003512195A
MTAVASARSCLVLAPHPDDETLGCGGVIMQKLAAGSQVNVVVATDGGASHLDDPASKTSRQDLVAIRERETYLACAKLGLAAEYVSFLRFPDGDLKQHAEALREQVAAMVALRRPSEIYVCALGDGHRDHVALAQAVQDLAAARRLGDAVHWEYPVWSFDFRSWRPPGRTNKAGYVLGVLEMLRMLRRARVSSVSLRGLQERKRKALDCHRSQLGLLEDEPDWPGLPTQFLSFFFRDRELFFHIPPGRFFP